jgi:hypothetical protein
MSPAPLVVLSSYEDFASDWNGLPKAAKVSIKNFLLLLQANPYNPEVQNACDLDQGGERYAYAISEGYALFWSVAEMDPVSVTHLDQITVKLLGIQRLH